MGAGTEFPLGIKLPLVAVNERNAERKTCFFHESCPAPRTKMERCFAVYSCGLMHLKNLKSQEYTVRDRGTRPGDGWPRIPVREQQVRPKAKILT